MPPPQASSSSSQSSRRLVGVAVGIAALVCYILLWVGATIHHDDPLSVMTMIPNPQTNQRSAAEGKGSTAVAVDDEVHWTDAHVGGRTSTRSPSSSTSNVVVPCTLSNFAQQARIWERLQSRCTVCAAKSLPPFCNVSASSALSATPPRFDFSQLPSKATSSFDVTSDTLSVVYSALGQRFHGPGGQSYVLEAIKQWRTFHSREESDVYLIVDDNMTSVPEIAQVHRDLGVILVPRSSIATPLWEEYRKVFYIQGYMHPGGSRTTGHKLFNQLVSERFFALHGLMEKRQLTHVLHFENDNLVYANLRRVVAAADLCGYRLASTFANTKHVIPGVLYIRDASAIEAACRFVVEFLSCGEEYGRRFTKRRKDYANDMTYLMTFYQLFGSRALGALPAWEHKPQENCMAELLWRREGISTTTAAVSSSLSLPALGMLQRDDERGVLFDLASFGQWYSFSVGTERPPLHVMNGIRGRFIDVTPPPKMVWTRDEQQRRVPVWNGYRILTLHIHAKNLNVFRS